MKLRSDTRAADIVGRLAASRIAWEGIKKEIAQAREHGHPGGELGHHVGAFVTVSGHKGTGVRELAEAVGKELGWPVADQELIQAVAEELGVEGRPAGLLDEIEANWVRDVLGELMPHEAVSRDSFVARLGHVIKLLGMHGDIVLVGHGAPFFLPRDRGLRVRVVAQEADRAARVVEEEQVDAAQAHKLLAHHDREERSFNTRYFGHDGQDAEHHDLVVNASSFPVSDLARMVVAALAARPKPSGGAGESL
jgi:cytidylate kinase